MAADSLNALAVVLASASIGALLEWVWNTMHSSRREKRP